MGDIDPLLLQQVNLALMQVQYWFYTQNLFWTVMSNMVYYLNQNLQWTAAQIQG
jgi:hypothetical protein